MDDARTAYQDHLDRTTRALWDRDWDEVVRHWLFPHQVRTSDREVWIGTTDELQRYAQAFRNDMEGLGATAYHRVCRAAEFDGKRLVGTHRTFILRGGNYVVDPYDADLTLDWDDSLWRGSAIIVHAGLASHRAMERTLTSI